MPSTSPGFNPSTSTSFEQVLPGAPTNSLQNLASFTFRHKRYITYVSGRQLNFLNGPNSLIQAITFKDELLAVIAETLTGKVAVASNSEAWILEPVTEGWNKVWWEKTLCLVREDAGDQANCLSWGSEGEILVGGSRSLSLFSSLPSSRTSSPTASPMDGEAVEERRPLWSKSTASPVQQLAFSPSASLIATCGIHDRLVKIWRRLSFEEGLFDHIYLPHPGAVTHLEWRPLNTHSEDRRESGVSGRHDDEPEILYTVANDGVLRVWRTGGVHDLDILALHTTIDLVSAIPDSPSLTITNGTPTPLAKRPSRYAFILPSDQFCAAVTATIGLETAKLSHSLEHLKENASKEPDVVVTLDGHGRMSAWGLQSIGHKRRPDTPSDSSNPTFHIVHAEGLPLRFPDGANTRFQAWFEDDKFHVLARCFAGYVQWWQGDVKSFFSTSAAGADRLKLVAYWSGHQSGTITALSGGGNGQSLVSCSADGEVAHWSPSTDIPLQNTASYHLSGRVLDLVLLGHYALALEARNEKSSLTISVVARDLAGRDLGRIDLDPKIVDEAETWRLSGAFDPDTKSGRVVAMSQDAAGYMLAFAGSSSKKVSVSEPIEFALPAEDRQQFICQPVAILDKTEPDRTGLIRMTKTGELLLYHVRTTASPSVEVALLSTIETGVQDATIVAASNDFAAIASSNGRELTIVNLRDGFLEHQQSFTERICYLQPFTKHNLLTVASEHAVDILAQGRYEHHDDTPSWVRVKQVSIAGIGLSIGAVAWLGDGSLAAAAGNSIFRSNDTITAEQLQEDAKGATDTSLTSREGRSISSIASQLKQPLPAWHPTLLMHLIRSDKWTLASGLLLRLLQKLRFWSEGDVLHPMLNVPAEQLYGAEDIHEEKTLDEDAVEELLQQLDEKRLPDITKTEQARLQRVIHAMKFCSEHVKGLDNAALRFLFSWKLQLLHLDFKLPNGTQLNGTSHQLIPEMHWRELAFAYHSTTQQPLLDILLTHHDNKVTWPLARRLGLFAWLSDREALEKIFDSLAQSAYRSSSPPDPIDASLYFLALHKKPTLLALWRIATWHKEQRTTMNFLKRDFGKVENRSAAKKNAYALMGKRRFEYAAAFFLLAGDPASATSVLASQCGDVMLAIAVARLYSGDGSDVLRRLVEERLVPEARGKGDRWMMSWCRSILLEKVEAAEALVETVGGVRRWEMDGPDTVVLYRELRKSPSDHEYDAILRSARILRRMGLWLPAVELVSQWDFKPIAPPIATNALPNGTYPVEVEPVLEANETPSVLDDFNSAPVQDDKAAREAKAAELLKKLKAKKQESVEKSVSEKTPKPEPTQFKEPEANSLLDSFGF